MSFADEEPVKRERLSDDVTVEMYDAYFRIIQSKPGVFIPDSLILPFSQVESLYGVLEEMGGTEYRSKFDSKTEVDHGE